MRERDRDIKVALVFLLRTGPNRYKRERERERENKADSVLVKKSSWARSSQERTHSERPKKCVIL